MSTASELRKPIYWIVAAKAIDYEQMLLLMANVKWDVKEIMSQHNIYVDSLLKVSIFLEASRVLDVKLKKKKNYYCNTNGKDIIEIGLDIDLFSLIKMLCIFRVVI